MKVKTSITISSDLLSEVDKVAPEGARSEFIEKAIRKYLELLHRDRRDKRDRKVLDSDFARLNAEALDALSFQVQG